MSGLDKRRDFYAIVNKYINITFFILLKYRPNRVNQKYLKYLQNWA